jgi:hypothetical protein
MGTFLASNFKIVDGTINVYGASRNVLPLEYYWVKIDIESLFYNMVSGMVSFRAKNDTCNRLNTILENIEAEHIAKYPQAKESRFNMYTLYDMLKTHTADKDTYINNSINSLSSWSASVRAEKAIEIDLYDKNWDEFKEHVTYLFNKFKASIERSFEKKQAVLDLL